MTPKPIRLQTIATQRLRACIFFVDTRNTFRYHIHSLKKKLFCALGIEFIKTVRGQEYIVEEK